MVNNIVERSPGKPLAKPVAGLAALLMWVVAIVLWSIAHLVTNPQAGAFVVDTGIVLASVGFAILSLEWVRQALNAMLFGLVAIILFAVFDFAQITVLVYMLRIIIPLLAILVPVNRISTHFRIFAAKP